MVKVKYIIRRGVWSQSRQLCWASWWGRGQGGCRRGCWRWIGLAVSPSGLHPAHRRDCRPGTWGPAPPPASAPPPGPPPGSCPPPVLGSEAASSPWWWTSPSSCSRSSAVWRLVSPPAAAHWRSSSAAPGLSDCRSSLWSRCSGWWRARRCRAGWRWPCCEGR